jgi:hypothetical protein
MSGWPDPDKPGVPLNPVITGEHYIGDSVALWYSDSRKWALIRGSKLRPPDWVAGQCWGKYIGPCPTSAEADTLRAENARLRAALEGMMSGSKYDEPTDWWVLIRTPTSKELSDARAALAGEVKP